MKKEKANPRKPPLAQGAAGEPPGMPMLWSKITVVRERIDAGAVDAIANTFRKAVEAAGAPEDAALLISRYRDAAGAVEIYFTPKAAEIAADLVTGNAGIPCNPPPSSEVELLSGSPAAMALLADSGP